MTNKLRAFGPITLLLAAGGPARTGRHPRCPRRRRPSRRKSASLSASASARRRVLPFPIFLALSDDSETAEVAKTLGQVLWDDLAFEREFYMIPRDTYQTIPGSDVDARRPIQSMAGTGRRRCRRRIGAQDR